MIKTMGNPQMMIQQMPQYKEVMNLINQNGGDAQKAFYAKAREMGIDPEQIMSVLRNA